MSFPPKKWSSSDRTFHDSSRYHTSIPMIDDTIDKKLALIGKKITLQQVWRGNVGCSKSQQCNLPTPLITKFTAWIDTTGSNFMLMHYL